MKKQIKLGVFIMGFMAQTSCSASYSEILKKRNQEINCSIPGDLPVLKSRQEIENRGAKAFLRPPYRNIQECEVANSLSNNRFVSECGIDFDYFLSKSPESAKNVVNIPNRLAENQESKTAIVYKNDQVGYGVIATDDIKKDSFIVPYLGKIVSQTRKEVLGNDYAFNLFPEETEGGLVIDAKEAGNISRFMNHSYTPNAVMVNGRHGNKVLPWLRALTKISAGEEICWNYGSGYWLGKGITPIPDKEIMIYQSEKSYVYAVKVQNQKFTHVIIGDDQICFELNLKQFKIVKDKGLDVIEITDQSGKKFYIEVR